MMDMMLLLLIGIAGLVLYLAENRLNFALFFGLVGLVGGVLVGTGALDAMALGLAEQFDQATQAGVLFYVGLSLAGLAALAANVLPRPRRRGGMDEQMAA
jgi:hypothetical protein